MEATDYATVHNLIHRYCDRIDRGDFEGMAALFAKADVFLPGSDQWIRHDPRALAAIYRQWVRIYPDGTPRTRHITTNVIIEAEGENQALAQSYVMVIQSAPELPLQPILAGRNVDRFVKEDGVWRFAERKIESDLYGDLSVHLLLPFGAPVKAGG